MDTLRAIEKLVDRARTEVVPTVDVGDGVMLRIAAQLDERRPFAVKPLTVVAGLSALAASIILFLAIDAWQTVIDPMTQLFGPVQVASLW